MRYFSTFSGIGGFELGIQQAYETTRSNHIQEIGGGEAVTEGELQENGEGLHPVSSEATVHSTHRDNDHSNRSTHEGQPTCVGYSEIDKYAIQIYEKHFPEHKNYGDITKINAEELPDFDLLVGGFPCQAFSIAGKRRGFEDTRGTMFFELARILRAKRPRAFLFENVKGLLSHDNGNTFRTIIATLDELGYDLQWQVCNSKNHGVPQNRERILIVGHTRGEPRPQVFPIGEVHGETTRSTTKAGWTKSETAISTTLATKQYRDEQTYIGVGTLRTHKDGNGFREVKSGLAPTIPARAREDGSGQPVIVQRPRGNNKGGEHTIAPTMTGAAYKDNNHVMGIRRLTPIECERLQGFPDNWTQGPSDTQRYKCLGNAVTVNLMRDVCVRLLPS